MGRFLFGKSVDKKRVFWYLILSFKEDRGGRMELFERQEKDLETKLLNIRQGQIFYTSLLEMLRNTCPKGMSYDPNKPFQNEIENIGTFKVQAYINREGLQESCFKTSDLPDQSNSEENSHICYEAPEIEISFSFGTFWAELEKCDDSQIDIITFECQICISYWPLQNSFSLDVHTEPGEDEKRNLFVEKVLKVLEWNNDEKKKETDYSCDEMIEKIHQILQLTY